jgi:biopolymer transport protein ExbB
VATTADISTGVYKSLLTTAAGLVVAIPTSLAYSFLSSRVNTLMHDMERAGIEVVNLITERPAASEPLISFGNRQRAAVTE